MMTFNCQSISKLIEGQILHLTPKMAVATTVIICEAKLPKISFSIIDAYHEQDYIVRSRVFEQQNRSWWHIYFRFRERIRPCIAS